MPIKTPKTFAIVRPRRVYNESMLQYTPLPWTWQGNTARRMSAVIDAKGHVVCGSLICQQSQQSYDTTVNAHKLIVEAVQHYALVKNWKIERAADEGRSRVSGYTGAERARLLKTAKKVQGIKI